MAAGFRDIMLFTHHNNDTWDESKQLSFDGRFKMLTLSDNKLKNSIKNAIRPEDTAIERSEKTIIILTLFNIT